MRRFIITALIGLLYVNSAHAARYWVRPTGILGGCLASATAPATDAGYVSTIAAGLACMSAAGDTVTIRTGTYPEIIQFNSQNVPSGSNFSSGAVTIEGLAGETVTLNPTTSVPVINVTTAGPNSDPHHIIFRNLTIDSINATWPGGGIGSNGNIHHIWFDQLIVKNANQKTGATGMVGMQLVGSDHIVSRSIFHHNGEHNDINQTGYAIYMQAASTTLEDNEFYANGAYGVQVFKVAGGVNNNIIRRNRFHNNGVSHTQRTGLWVGSGSGNQVYNNLFYNETGNGIEVGTCASCSIYNNSFYGITRNGITVSVDASSLALRNNVIKNVGLSSIEHQSGASSTRTNNLCHIGTTTLCQTVADPLFADAANADFRPCDAAGTPNVTCTGVSPLIGAGADLSSTFTTDFAGSLRIAPWTIGAYGAGAGVPSPACPATPALVASWGFDGNGTDASGNGNTATLGSGLTYTSGKYGQALLMNGTAAATVADSLSQFLCTGFTLSASVNPTTSPTAFAAIVSKDRTSGSGYWLYANSETGYGFSNGPMAGYTEGSNVYAGYSTLPALNVWSDYAITYDSTLPSANLKIWLNGVVVTSATATATISQSSGLLYIGGSNFGEFLPSGWKLDEVRVYNHARTQAQINTDRNTALTALSPNTVVIKVSGGSTWKYNDASVVKYGSPP